MGEIKDQGMAEEEEGTQVITMPEVTVEDMTVIVEEQEVEIVEEAEVMEIVGEETLVALMDHQNCLVTTTGGD